MSPGSGLKLPQSLSHQLFHHSQNVSLICTGVIKIWIELVSNISLESDWLIVCWIKLGCKMCQVKNNQHLQPTDIFPVVFGLCLWPGLFRRQISTFSEILTFQTYSEIILNHWNLWQMSTTEKLFQCASSPVHRISFGIDLTLIFQPTLQMHRALRLCLCQVYASTSPLPKGCYFSYVTNFSNHLLPKKFHHGKTQRRENAGPTDFSGFRI